MPVGNETTGFWPTWCRVVPRQWVWSERTRRSGSSRDSRLAPGGAGRYGTDWVLGTAPLAERQSSPGRRPGRIHLISTGSATPGDGTPDMDVNLRGASPLYEKRDRSVDSIPKANRPRKSTRRRQLGTKRQAVGRKPHPGWSESDSGAIRAPIPVDGSAKMLSMGHSRHARVS
jgi:hypothetical protein